MAPGQQQVEEATYLREKLIALQAELERQKARLGIGEERFRLLADAAPVMMWMSDKSAVCMFFNRKWLDFRGRTLQEEVGNRCAEGLHPDDRELCLETYLKAFACRQAFRMQYRIQGAGGEYCWVEGTGVPHFEEDGEFSGFVGAAVDISDQRRNMFKPDEQSVRLVFTLTERERQVLVLIAQGRSTKE